jgi:hypothetical protein
VRAHSQSKVRDLRKAIGAPQDPELSHPTPDMKGYKESGEFLDPSEEQIMSSGLPLFVKMHLEGRGQRILDMKCTVGNQSSTGEEREEMEKQPSALAPSGQHVVVH